MGFDAETMVGYITSGTSDYLVEFLPVGAFITGLILAFVVGDYLVGLFSDLYFFRRGGGGDDNFQFWQYRRQQRQLRRGYHDDNEMYSDDDDD